MTTLTKVVCPDYIHTNTYFFSSREIITYSRVGYVISDTAIVSGVDGFLPI